MLDLVLLLVVSATAQFSTLITKHKMIIKPWKYEITFSPGKFPSLFSLSTSKLSKITQPVSNTNQQLQFLASFIFKCIISRQAVAVETNKRNSKCRRVLKTSRLTSKTAQERRKLCLKKKALLIRKIPHQQEPKTFDAKLLVRALNTTAKFFISEFFDELYKLRHVRCIT